MPDEKDRPIHLPLVGLAGTEGGGGGALRVAEPDVTTLIALWPGPTPPTREEVHAALESTLGFRVPVLGEIDPEEESFLWNMVLEGEGLPGPTFLWSEPAKTLRSDELGTDALAAEALACKWVLGLQCVLDVNDPLTSLTRHMRLITAAAADAPAVLDVEASKWHLRPAIEELFLNDEMEPPGEVLWTIHAVGIDSAEDDEDEGDENERSGGRVWLHTHGLWRCGKPELEMLEVPVEHALAAGYVINALAEQLLERELPEPGEAMEIGSNLHVTVQPWQDVAAFLEPGTPGSMNDRQSSDGDNPHVGVRAVVCAAQPRGTLRKLWLWPAQVLQSLEQDGVVLYMTKRATERLSRRAQATWPELAMAFSSLRGLARPGEASAPADDAVDGAAVESNDSSAPLLPAPQVASDALFLVKAGFREGDNPDAPREHVWFEVRQFDGDRARGRLVNAPRGLSGMKSGEMHWLPRSRVTDWQVMTCDGAFGPSETVSLREHVRRSVEQAEAGS